MVREIMLYTSNDLRDFMHLACASPLDIGVHTMDNQIADGKSVLGLMAIDYKKPVKVVSEDKKFLKQLDRWAVDKDIYCLLYTSPSPRDTERSRMPSSA